MLNETILMGRITHDLELKQTPSGYAVCSFSIAVDRAYSGKGAEKKTDFFNIVAWRGTAEFVERYFHKGDMIAVVGELQTRSYEAKDGSKRSLVEILANKVSFCGGKQTNGESNENATAGEFGANRNETTASEEFIDVNSGDLPF